MSQSELEERLGAVGRRTSGFETGAERRGLFGRGAKDIVHFGQAEWESVKDGRCSYLRLIFDGQFTGQAEIGPKRLSSDRKDGTDARLDVESRFTVPQHDNLLRKLRNHYALRPILQDRNREVLLVDVSRNRTDRVRFEPPKGTQIVDEELPIPGYPGKGVIFSLFESSEPLAEEREDRDYWRHSILITSDRAAYEVFDGGRFAKDPYGFYLRRLWGHASVPGIAELIRNFDDAEEAGETPDERNPIRLVRRDRKGLVSKKDHPFVSALYEVLEQALEPHLEKMKKASEDAVGRIDEGTRRRWNAAGSALAKLMEEEEGAGEGVEGRLPPIGLSLIPQVRIVEPEANARVWVRYRPPKTDQSAMKTPVVGILAAAVGRGRPARGSGRAGDRGGAVCLGSGDDAGAGAFAVGGIPPEDARRGGSLREGDPRQGEPQRRGAGAPAEGAGVAYRVEAGVGRRLRAGAPRAAGRERSALRRAHAAFLPRRPRSVGAAAGPARAGVSPCPRQSVPASVR